MPSRTFRARFAWRAGVVGALVAMLVVLVRGTRRQRTILRLVAALGFRWDIPNPVDVVGGFFAGIGNDVYNFVRSAIGWLVDRLRDAFGALTSDVWNIASSLLGAISNLSGWAGRAIQSAFDTLQGHLWDVITWAGGRLDDLGRAILNAAAGVLNTARGWVDDAIRVAWSLAGNVLSTVRGWVDDAARLAWQLAGNVLGTVQGWVADAVRLAWSLTGDALNTVRGWIDDAFRFVDGLIHQAVQAALNLVGTLLRDALDGLEAVLRAAIHEVQRGVDDVTGYIGGTVTGIVGIVEDVIDWLIALATLPFSEARDLWDAFRSAQGHDVLDHKAGFMDRVGNDAADRIAKWVAS